MKIWDAAKDSFRNYFDPLRRDWFWKYILPPIIVWSILRTTWLPDWSVWVLLAVIIPLGTYFRFRDERGTNTP